MLPPVAKGYKETFGSGMGKKKDPAKQGRIFLI